MKHLITDTQIIDYLEGRLSKEECHQLKLKLSDNDELAMLYHAQLAYEAGTEQIATELIGSDDETINRQPMVKRPQLMAANIIINDDKKKNF